RAWVLAAGAPLLLAAASVDWSTAETIGVTMVDDRFVPDRLSLHHGRPYRLHLENRGNELHEFTAPEFLADTIVRDPSVLANGGKEVLLHPGASADLYLMPLRPGSFR